MGWRLGISNLTFDEANFMRNAEYNDEILYIFVFMEGWRCSEML